MSARSRFHPRRVLETWRALSPYLGASTGRVVALSTVSGLRGASEAVILVVIARVALGLAEGDERVLFGLGPLGDVRLTVAAALGVAAALAVVMLCLQLVAAHLSAGMQATAMATARIRLSSAFLGASWDVQAREREGHLQEVMTTYVQRIGQGSLQIAALLTSSFNLAALIAAAIVVDAVAALTLVVSVIVLATLLRPLNRLARRRASVNRDVNTDFATAVTETAGVAQEIATFDVGPAVSDGMRQGALRAARAQQRVAFVKMSASGVYQSLSIAVVLVGLAVINATGVDTIASLGAVVLLLLRSMSYGQRLQTVTVAMNEVLPYLRQARSQEARYRKASRTAGDRPLERIESLELDHVSYDYGDGSEALADLSLAIHRGEVIGVVGPSGAGKSTLIQLLLRLRLPTSGSYRINGEPAEDHVLDDWYRLLAVVAQTPRLFEGTAADNIRFFRDDISQSAIVAAARRAHIHEEIEGWPDGYETVLRGSGGGVSGGQAQRLCIARALAADPQLLVLDEPTSALDTHSEALIQEALDELRGRMTMVIIAHRLSTLRRCDRILVLQGGRMRGFDTPDALQLDNSYYRDALELSRSA